MQSNKKGKTMNLNPLVSVVMPTYNRADMIEKAINSVMNQTYENIQLVIVDDFSTDHTDELVKSKFNEFLNCTAKDKRSIKYLFSTNEGIPFVRNEAVKSSDGEYIAFLDSDDEWNLEKISKQMEYMKCHPDCDIVFAGYENVSKNGNIITNQAQLKLLTEEYQMYMASACLKKEMFDKIGYYDVSITNAQDDYEWVCRAKICGYNMNHLIDEVLYYRTVHDGNISLRNDAYSPENKKAVWMKAIRNAAKRRK